MPDIITQSLLLFAPILAANQAAHLLRVLHCPDASTCPLIFGKNKTLLPFLVGPMLAMAVLSLEGDLDFFRHGLALGLGAVVGDHVKSAIKRSCLVGLPPGAPWFFDRIDFAIGGTLAALWFVPGVTVTQVLLVVAMAYPVHLVGNAVSYRFGWRKTPH